MVFKSEFKGAIMNRGLVKFISLFIFDKEKKQAFRIKYDAIERLRQRLSNERGRINALEYNLGMLAFKVLPHICVDYLHGLNANQVSSLDEHKQNVEALKANLEEESLYNLNKILNTIEKRKYSKIFIQKKSLKLIRLMLIWNMKFKIMMNIYSTKILNYLRVLKFISIAMCLWTKMGCKF